MSERRLWFGEEQRPLAGVLNAPDDGQARGAVLLCPPLAREHVTTYPTFRVLALGLADAGFVVLRFDYDGTGDSAGRTDDHDRVAAWTRSTKDAAALLRATVRGPLAMVGMRMGGLLAAAASFDVAPDALVLWDTCESGRTFVREQTMLQAAGQVTAPSVGAADLPGYSWPDATVKDLADLTFTKLGRPRARRILVLAHPARVESKALRQALGDDGVEVLPAIGQERLLDVPSVDAQIPTDAVKDTIAWLDAALPHDRSPVATVGQSEAVVPAPDGRGEVAERYVELGPLHLIGVRAEPVGGATAGVPTVVFLNTANEHHIGPGRQWVELARDWAADHGLPSVRVDMSGLGDSPARPGQPRDVTYAPEALDDVVDIAHAIDVSPDGTSNVMFVGLCSGAYTAIEGGLLVGARAVMALSPVPGVKTAEMHAGEVDPRRRATHAPRPWVAKMAATDVAARWEDRIPGWVWALADRAGVVASPASGVRDLVHNATDTLIVAGPHDARPYLLRAKADLVRMRQTGHFRLEVVEGLDHALLAAAAREDARHLLNANVARLAGSGLLGRSAQPARTTTPVAPTALSRWRARRAAARSRGTSGRT